MRLGLICDGNGQGTMVIDRASGEPIQHVKKLSYRRWVAEDGVSVTTLALVVDVIDEPAPATPAEEQPEGPRLPIAAAGRRPREAL